MVGGTDTLQEHRPSWREVVTMFKAAGQGLAAAHAAGIVHRDFKPANVLIGGDGRPRVTDFGIARAADETLAQDAARPGRVAGTPAYMAPEQHEGQPGDARSDQFAFCAALHEALYGERPFSGRSDDSVLQKRSGRLTASPKGRRVPRWVQRVVQRGLCANPDERYRSMPELLIELGRDRTATRWRWGAAATVTALLVISALAYRDMLERRSLMCKGAQSQLVGVWDQASKQAARAGFLGTGKSYALDTWRRVEQALEAQTRAWVAMHQEACEATRVRGEQSDEVLSLRMACLAERREEVRVLVRLFAQADSALLKNAVRAAQSVGSPRDCANVEALLSPVRPPKDPASRGAVDEARKKLAEATALRLAARYQQGIEVTTQVMQRAEELGYGPLRAEALYQKGWLERFVGDYAAARASLSEAMQAAIESRHDVVATQAAAELVYVVGYCQEQFAQADELAKTAAAFVGRMGKGGSLEVDFLLSVAAFEYARGSPQAALVSEARALQIIESAPDEYPPLLLGQAYANLAGTLEEVGRVEEAIVHHRKGLELMEHELGTEHPQPAIVKGNLAKVYCDLQRFQDARPLAEQALASAEKDLGPANRASAYAHLTMGRVLAGEGQLDAAGEHFTRALEIYERTVGLQSASAGFVYKYLGELRLRQGQAAQAEQLYERSVAILKRALGAEAAALREPLAGLAQARAAKARKGN